MTRTIQDANLEIWEAYASAGESGFPEHAAIVFHCISDRSRRARRLTREADKSHVESQISTLSDSELAALLAEAPELK